MSNESIHLSDLSSIANDSQGHALARYLCQRERGQGPMRIFGNPQNKPRISIPLDLVKATINENVNGNDKSNLGGKETQLQAVPVVRQEQASNTQEVRSQSVDPSLVNNVAENTPNIIISKAPTATRPMPQTPKSSQAQSRISSADRLRRLSFKHLLGNTCRRVLLKELNSTDNVSITSQFAPGQTSTPMGNTPKETAAQATENQNVVENIQPSKNTAGINSALAALCKSADQLILSPTRKAVTTEETNANHNATLQHNASAQQYPFTIIHSPLFPQLQPVQLSTTNKTYTAMEETTIQNLNRVSLAAKGSTNHNVQSMLLTDDENEDDVDGNDNIISNNDNDNLNSKKTVVSVSRHQSQKLIPNITTKSGYQKNETFIQPRAPINKKSKLAAIATTDTESENYIEMTLNTERNEIDYDNDGDNEDTMQPKTVPLPIVIQTDIKTEMFSDESNIEHVSLKKPKNLKKNYKSQKRSGKVTPEYVRTYKNATKKLTSKAKRFYMNKSKRSLYSESTYANIVSKSTAESTGQTLEPSQQNDILSVNESSEPTSVQKKLTTPKTREPSPSKDTSSYDRESRELTPRRKRLPFHKQRESTSANSPQKSIDGNGKQSAERHNSSRESSESTATRKMSPLRKIRMRTRKEPSKHNNSPHIESRARNQKRKMSPVRQQRQRTFPKTSQKSKGRKQSSERHNSPDRESSKSTATHKISPLRKTRMRTCKEPSKDKGSPDLDSRAHSRSRKRKMSPVRKQRQRGSSKTSQKSEDRNHKETAERHNSSDSESSESSATHEMSPLRKSRKHARDEVRDHIRKRNSVNQISPDSNSQELTHTRNSLYPGNSSDSTPERSGIRELSPAVPLKENSSTHNGSRARNQKRKMTPVRQQRDCTSSKTSQKSKDRKQSSERHNWPDRESSKSTATHKMPPLRKTRMRIRKEPLKDKGSPDIESRAHSRTQKRKMSPVRKQRQRTSSKTSQKSEDHNRKETAERHNSSDSESSESFATHEMSPLRKSRKHARDESSDHIRKQNAVNQISPDSNSNELTHARNMLSTRNSSVSTTDRSAIRELSLPLNRESHSFPKPSPVKSRRLKKKTSALQPVSTKTKNAKENRVKANKRTSLHDLTPLRESPDFNKKQRTSTPYKRTPSKGQTAAVSSRDTTPEREVFISSASSHEHVKTGKLVKSKTNKTKSVNKIKKSNSSKIVQPTQNTQQVTPRKSTRIRKPVELHPYAIELWSRAFGEKQIKHKKNNSELIKERKQEAFDKLRANYKNKQNEQQKTKQPYIKLRRIQNYSTTEDGQQIDTDRIETTQPTLKTINSHDDAISWLQTLNSTSNQNLNLTAVPDIINNPVIKREMLQFVDHKGIELAFFDQNAENGSVGFMRFRANASKKRTSLKFFNMSFICLQGEFEFVLDGTHHCLKACDFIRIKKGQLYAITNIINDTSILLIVKNKNVDSSII